jgi:protein-S-isoprenylcysteine O-methyltransferase Ste14
VFHSGRKFYNKQYNISRQVGENMAQHSFSTQAQRLVLIQFILFAALAISFGLLPAEQVGWVRLLGMGLAALGVGVVLLAVLQHYRINRNLVNVSPEPNAGNQLVQTGLYGLIRHPIYTGVMLAALGAALAHGHLIPLLIALVLVAFFTYKSTFEESLLMQTYPHYAAYRQRTGRFLPRLF